MKFRDFVDKGFWALLLGVFMYATNELSSLRKSTEALNVKIAVVIEKVESHENRLKRLEKAP